MGTEGTSPKILVAIASFGTKNDRYLARVIEEYRSMPYHVNVVVFSNIYKDLGPAIEVRVGLPDKNAWSLPFGHKQLFAERLDEYDLFIYAEDDILITERNIEAFLAVSPSLPDGVIAGFVRAERDNTGGLHFDPVESHFHWDPASVQVIGDDTYAYHTNEHSACFLLTQQQLKSAIHSGGFLVGPYEGRYDMLCCAATDPYTRCGFKKLICLTRLEDFTVYHLPNYKHITRPYRASSVFYRQLEALLTLETKGRPRTMLFNPETKVLNAKWSKDYYELVREDLISLVPSGAKNVLSVGCGWGATEGSLVKRGLRVVGIPMDSVIGSCAEDHGVEVVYGDFATARSKLNNERFDCIVFANVLHLLPDPVTVLASFAELLDSAGVVIVATPNFASLVSRWRRLTGDPYHKALGAYRRTGIHLTSRRVVSTWLQTCGMVPATTRGVFSERAHTLNRASLGLLDSSIATELLIVGLRKAAKNLSHVTKPLDSYPLSST